MLEPRARQLLFEALQPPPGFRFDQGIGTTYTLDLLSLLTAPLAFTLFEQQAESNGQPAIDSLEILESLRRHVDHLTVFCHASRIAPPKHFYPQLAFVESSIVECQAKPAGSFHPKVWVLRWMNDTGAVRYRLLCLSRNLAYSRAWDTLLALDGAFVPDRKERVARSAPLAEFVRALPGFATRRVDGKLISRIETLASELERTEFELPDGMTDLRFWPLGIGRSRSPLAEAGDRLLIVSPFLTLGRLEALANERSEVMLVSTGFALAALNRRPRGVRKFYTLQDRAMAETDSDQEVQADSGAEAIAQFDLHAKLYVSESGRDAHIWTGSANATDAAFSQNVEFLVELTGPRKRFGIDVLLEPATGETRFINLLQDASSQVAIQPEEPALKALEDRLNRLRNAIAAGSFEVRVNRVDDLFSLKLVFSGASPLTVEDMTLRCWPVTVSASNAVGINQLEPGCVAAAFDGLPVKSITSFIGFDLHGRAAGNECHQQFVLNAALVGAPEGRREQVLRAAVGDNRKMLRFLWLLLADEGVDVPEMDGAGGETRGTGNGHTSALPGGLFEMLLRTLDRNPARLDHLSGLLKELRHGADGADLLPAGFDAVWEPIWRQRERLGQHVPAVQR